MFRDAHPLELILFCVLTGVTFSLYVIIKFIPADYEKPSTFNYKLMSEEIEYTDDARRDWESSGKNAADPDN